MNTATRRFQSISAIMRELNQAALEMQTVNDLLTMYVGAANTPCARRSSWKLRLATSTPRSWPSGHSSPAET